MYGPPTNWSTTPPSYVVHASHNPVTGSVTVVTAQSAPRFQRTKERVLDTIEWAISRLWR